MTGTQPVFGKNGFLRPHSVRAGWWYLFGALVVAGDYALGPYGQFSVTFVVPILLAAWYSGFGPALALAIAIPLARFTLMWTFFDIPGEATLTTLLLRTGVYVVQAALVSRLAAHERHLEREVEILEGLLPVCMHCKNIRNEAGEWETLEHYIGSRTEATFTHGVCEPCASAHYPELMSRSPRSSAGARQPRTH